MAAPRLSCSRAVRLSAGCAVLVTAAAVVATVAPATADAVTSHPATSHPATSHPAASAVRDRSSATQLANGVTLSQQQLSIGGDPQLLTELTVNLAVKGVSINAASPSNLVGARRATVQSQVAAAHALAGINADFFNLDDDDATPRGALVASGLMRKSPTTARNANLVIRKSGSGYVASIGALPFTGSVTRVRARAHNTTRSLAAVNSLTVARAGGLSLLTQEMAPSSLGRSCALVTGTITGSGSKRVWQVSQVSASAKRTPAFTATTWGLVSCGGSSQSWLTSQFRRGDHATVVDSLTGGTPWAAVSGGSVLVRNGAGYDDPEGEDLPYKGQNAETFACVSRSGQQVTLGTFDGYQWNYATGVTYHQLKKWMVQQGCWSGVVLDGGGSTILVARQPGQGLSVIDSPAEQNPYRPVADSLVVYG